MSESGLRKIINRRELSYFQAKPHSPIRMKQEWLDEYIDARTHRTADMSDTKPTMGNGRPGRPRRSRGKPVGDDGNDYGFTWELMVP